MQLWRHLRESSDGKRNMQVRKRINDACPIPFRMITGGVIKGLVVSANFAISADGKISSVDSIPSGWTSARDHDRLIELRQEADAIIVGRGTLQNDQMSLTIPGPRQPLRCVVTREGALRGDEKIFTTPGGDIHVLCTEKPGKSLPGASIHVGNLPTFLNTLHENHGVRHLHCEGGGQLMSALLELDCIETLHLTWAARSLFGGTRAPTIIGHPGSAAPGEWPFLLDHCTPVAGAGEIFLTYRRRERSSR
jgi:riboflavin biosynthesis pyrimidine reductase